MAEFLAGAYVGGAALMWVMGRGMKPALSFWVCLAWPLAFWAIPKGQSSG
jgi:hypothetical protein